MKPTQTKPSIVFCHGIWELWRIALGVLRPLDGVLVF